MAQSCSYSPPISSYFPFSSRAHDPKGFSQMDDSWLSYLRDMCDRYFDPRECDPGAGITRFYSDGIENVNYLAELALAFYNEKEQKNFYFEKVGKINKAVVLRCLTFWARTAESDESRLFRGVVKLLGGHKVLLCEIKGDNELTIPVDHSENCRLSSRVYNYVANDSAGGSIGANFGSAVGLGDVDLSNVDGFRPMGHSMAWALRDVRRLLCDTYFDPCDYDPGAGITIIHFDGQEIITCFASFALEFYNETEQENFCFEEVAKLNIFIAYYCLTFWARTPESDERRLFRGVVHVMGVIKVVLCEIKEDDKITIPVDHSENCRLKRSRIDDYKADGTDSGSVDTSSGAAVRHGCVVLGMVDCSVDLGKVDGFFQMDDSVLSSLRELCDKFFDPCDCDPAAGITRFHFDGLEYVKELAESALKFYNEKEQKNLYIEKVGKLNLFITYYCLTFWARSAESDERHLFRGVVDVLGGVNVMLCEIKDGDEITSPVDNSENCLLKCSRIDDYDANDSADSLVDASFGAALSRGGVDLGKVDGFSPMDDSWLSYLRDMCDRYFDPRECDPGAGITRFYSDGIENVNYLAELALAFYNEKEQKNFYFEKVGKINKAVVLRCLTFWARTAESDESRLFRGVVKLLGGHKVLLCEIKGDDELTIPDDHSENCRLARSRIPYYLANESFGGLVDANSGAAGGLGGVDLCSVDGSDVASRTLNKKL